ncbi:MAG TPA: LysM peptidoglycan-binding domain-containing protein [bacterium]|jgi:nucleoid-associated protein YgaU|nr:LysM peptidoglycan-binding domain-containing protein [bacterium]
MNLKQTLSMGAAAGLALIVASGCAKRQQQEAVPSPTPAQLESAFQTPTPVPELPTPAPTPHRNSYIVKPGDSLWAIAGDPSVQGDNFRWPLLFKANRDQIIDPDLIEPAQDLTWKDNYNTDEIGDAVSKAQETPPYAPHSAPRKQLPLKY